MTCPRVSSIGTPCDLEAGHHGDHSITYPGYKTLTWNDDADRRFIDRESRKGLGT